MPEWIYTQKHLEWTQWFEHLNLSCVEKLRNVYVEFKIWVLLWHQPLRDFTMFSALIFTFKHICIHSLQREESSHTYTHTHWRTHTWDLLGGSVPCIRAFQLLLLLLWDRNMFFFLFPGFFSNLSRDCNLWSSGHKLWTFRLLSSWTFR